MNTETGYIYTPEQIEALRKASGHKTDEIQTEFRQQFSPQEITDFQTGRIVPVSERVANYMREGKASVERKAARQARRNNR